MSVGLIVSLLDGVMQGYPDGEGKAPKVPSMQFSSLFSEGTVYAWSLLSVTSLQLVQALSMELCLALCPSFLAVSTALSWEPFGGSPAPVGALCWTQPWHVLPLLHLAPRSE